MSTREMKKVGTFFYGDGMTVVAIKDGQIAADTIVTSGNHVLHGQVCKIYKVPSHCGGGYIGVSGDLASAKALVAYFLERGALPSDIKDVSVLWLDANSEVWCSDGPTWYQFDAPYYAVGSGEEAALAAMSVGATAEEAVRAACRHVLTCAEPINSYRIGE